MQTYLFLKCPGVCTQTVGSGTVGSPHPGCTSSNPWCDTTANPPKCKCGDESNAGATNIICNDLNPYCTATSNPPVCECDSDGDVVCDEQSSICQIQSSGVTNTCHCGGDRDGTGVNDMCTDSYTELVAMPSCLCDGKYQVGGIASTCSKCKIDEATEMYGVAQGTCNDTSKCYEDGSCRGKIFQEYSHVHALHDIIFSCRIDIVVKAVINMYI